MTYVKSQQTFVILPLLFGLHTHRKVYIELERNETEQTRFHPTCQAYYSPRYFLKVYETCVRVLLKAFPVN